MWQLSELMTGYVSLSRDDSEKFQQLSIGLYSNNDRDPFRWRLASRIPESALKSTRITTMGGFCSGPPSNIVLVSGPSEIHARLALLGWNY
jgi:hypothetical protein